MDYQSTKAKPQVKAASNSDDQGGKLNVYLPAGYIGRMNQLLDMLDEQGVDVRDKNRPENLSKSKLIKYLVDEELKRHGIETE
jgi:hypothetical protein